MASALSLSPPSGGFFHYNYPGGYAYPGPFNPASPYSKSGGYTGPYASQYHAQDGAGRASFGYGYPGQAAANYRDANGNQVGTYAYINPNGKDVRVSFTAGTGGFRVFSNDLPVAPEFNGKAPEPVKDSPEVVAAKEAFFQRFNKEALNRKVRDTSSKSEPGYPVEVKVVGKKNEVKKVLASKDFLNDLKWKSVDLDEDGFPDVAVESDPVVPPKPAITTPALVPHPVPVPAPGPLVVPGRLVGPGSHFEDAFDLSLSGYYLNPYNPYSTYDHVRRAAGVPARVSRKKRQVPLYPTNNLLRDFVYNSVDLNKDGQPDQAIYTGYPYPYYAYNYPYYNGFY